jgi:DUF971 family protein
MEGDPLMASNPIFVQAITQKDNFNFQIVWTNGTQSTFKLYDLQKNCPCAGCHQARNANKEIFLNGVKHDVRAARIKSVGRYALRIEFTTGCSNGIYDFEFLQNLRGSCKTPFGA